MHCGSRNRATELGKNTRVLNQCSKSTSSYNSTSAEIEPQNTPIPPVDNVPLPKRKGELRRTLEKESEILPSSFKN
jgi:hypothetical protein